MEETDNADSQFAEEPGALLQKTWLHPVFETKSVCAQSPLRHRAVHRTAARQKSRCTLMVLPGTSTWSWPRLLLHFRAVNQTDIHVPCFLNTTSPFLISTCASGIFSYHFVYTSYYQTYQNSFITVLQTSAVTPMEWSAYDVFNESDRKSEFQRYHIFWVPSMCEARSQCWEPSGEEQWQQTPAGDQYPHSQGAYNERWRRRHQSAVW